MKIIKELMEVYAEYLQIPITLMDEKMHIEFYEQPKKIDYKNNGFNLHVEELKQYLSNIQYTTAISISDMTFSTSPYYILTPTFRVNNENYLLCAGPFLVSNYTENRIITTLTLDQLNNKVEQLEKLYEIFMDREKQQHYFPTNLKLEIIRDVLSINGDYISPVQYIEKVFDCILNYEQFDFIGLAAKERQNLYTIKMLKGKSELSVLENKTFFEGEGILGKAGLLSHEIIWSESTNSQGADYFNRYGVFPKQLFAMPIDTSTFTGVFFVGSYHNQPYTQAVVHVFQMIIAIMKKVCIINEYIEEIEGHNKVMLELYNLIDFQANDKQKKDMEGKINDYFYAVNNQEFICYTNRQGQLKYIGSINGEIINKHREAQLAINDQKIWIHQNVIHAHFNDYGFYTISFKENSKIHQHFIQISILHKLIFNAMPNEEHVYRSYDFMFDVLKYTNKDMHQLATITKNAAQNLGKLLEIPYQTIQKVINLCKVLPYPEELIENQIYLTDEWNLYKEAKELIAKQKVNDEACIEVQMTSFIYAYYILQSENFPWLSDNLIQLFIHALSEQNIVMPQASKEIAAEFIDIYTVVDKLPLTHREKEVLKLIVKGLNNFEAADELNISIHTVKNHVTNILKKLNVSDRIQLMAKIIRIQQMDV